jgi:fibronectin type 3 domain-containing protein
MAVEPLRTSKLTVTNIIRSVVLSLFSTCLAGGLFAQTVSDIGPGAPSTGANDIFQLSTSGDTTSPDGLNYFTDNDPPAGQTFTTGSSATRLTSVAIKTAGLNSGGGYGTPASTPTLYLRIYSISGSTATLLIALSAPNSGYTDGDWLRWSGMNVPLEANKTYAFSFGTKPSGGGWAALAVATNAYAGGEIALVPTSGGAITTGGSHSYDAVFALGLQPATNNLPSNIPLPSPTYGWNLGNTLEATWGVPTVTQAPFYTAANAGFNAVRIPCAWDFNADQTTYQINPAFMAQVKQAVDWALAAGMVVVINDHWDGGWMETHIGSSVDPTITAKIKAYWTQIAATFAGYDNRLLFAAANEPNIADPAAMATLIAYYQTFVNTVRGVGGNNTNRWLVLQGGGDVSWFNTLPSDPTPNRLMVEYHDYTPFQFTQLTSDVSWGSPLYFWGPAYHYSGDPTRNCTSPEEGTIDAAFQQLADQFVSKGVPVMIGEFQAAAKGFLTGTEATYNTASAHYWNKYSLDSAQAHGLSPFYWSTPGSPFDWNTGAIDDAQRVAVLTGGMAPPPPNGAPYAASGLSATLVNGQASLSWAAASGATSYNVYRAAESGNESTTPVATGITGTSYSDTNLNAGTTYYYQVVAVNASGTSGFSPEAHVTTPGINPDPAQFNFETDSQLWSASGSQISGVATSAAQHFAGKQALAVTFSGTAAGTSSVTVSNVVVATGTTITFHVWIPSGSQINAISPYLQDYNWGWSSAWYGNLTANAWNTISLAVPSTAVSPLKVLGLQFSTSAAWSGTCYIDSVSVPSATLPPAAPTNLAASGGNSSVSLTWNPSTGANSYTILRSGSSGGYTPVAGGTTTNSSYTDTGLASGTTYYYVVTAANTLSGTSGISNAASATTYTAVQSWRLSNFGTVENTGNAADSADPDGDGMTNAQEFTAGTNPNNPSSVFKVGSVAKSGSDMVVSFASVVGRSYRVERSDTLQSRSWTTVWDNIAGSAGVVQVTDAGGASAGRRFYRVVVW